jgi:hypothetical protein
MIKKNNNQRMRTKIEQKKLNEIKWWGIKLKKNSNQKNEDQTGLNEIKCLGTKLKKKES